VRKPLSASACRTSAGASRRGADGPDASARRSTPRPVRSRLAGPMRPRTFGRGALTLMCCKVATLAADSD